MDWKGRGGGTGRGGGAGRHASSNDHGGGIRDRGRGRGRGGGRGQEDRHSGQGGISESGFVAGAALGDWEASTPERSSLNSRRDRANEGHGGGSRQFSFHGRSGSNGTVRSAQNPFTSVSYSYTACGRQRDESTSNANTICQLAKEDAATVSTKIAVVVPATAGRAEVYMDRGRYQEALESLDFTARTTGLGFVDEDPAVCSNHVPDACDSTGIRAGDISGAGNENDGAAIDAMKVDTNEGSYLELKTPVRGKHSRSAHKSNKCSQVGPSRGRSSGFISIGGVKIWTDQGITDESEGLDEEPDVCSAHDFATGKRQWGKGRKLSNSKLKKKFPEKSGAHQRGQRLEDSFTESGESIIDSSNSEIEKELAEDYLANAGSLDAAWLLRDRLFKQIPVEDMAIQVSEDDRDTSTNTGASGSERDLSESGYVSPEGMWSLQRQSKGKGLMETDDESDSELEYVAEKLLFEGDFADGLDSKGGRERGPSLQLRDLDLDDSQSDEDDSEDEDDVDQLFERLEDANFMPVKSPKTPATEKLSMSNIGKSIQPMTWPVAVHKTKKKSKSVPGSKKRQRKETIATKRNERAMKRGLDLQAINSALEDIVVRGTDIYAFAPMEDRDRAQIHRLAAMYRLKSGSQGSGKRRFTVVTRTKYTGLPTAADKYRLASMLGDATALAHSSKSLTGEDGRMAKKANNAAREAFLNMQGPTSKGSRRKHQKLMQVEPTRKSKSKREYSGLGQSTTEKSGERKSRSSKYANKPMSFISSGQIGNEEENILPGLGPATYVITKVEAFSVHQTGETSSSRSAGIAKSETAATLPPVIGTFEAHTRGFGSRMMSKMGFVEGQGLGRDGQGIASPLEAFKRPKSLGLGAYAPPPPT